MAVFTRAETVDFQPCACDLSPVTLLEAVKQAGVMTRSGDWRYRLLIHVTETRYAMYCCYLTFGADWHEMVELCVMPDFAPDEWALDGADRRVHSEG